ncbi:hypothetical protein ACJMK2_004594 [Sinanodonta woodiana]|uniref:Uncharacterized protein n=1 Tax=Sinanodonta woodiana TaxID=1069815 RepID=A0ABD3Y1S5_SINWO
MGLADLVLSVCKKCKISYSQACTSAIECDLHVIHCGSGWHVLCDHGLCTCAQNGIVQGCTRNSECVDGIHTCSEFRPVWRCVIREINNVTRGTCSCHHTE